MSRGAFLRAYKYVKALLKKSVADFLRIEAPTRGAAISFYTVTAFVPVLIVAMAIAALVFGEAAARGAIVEELRGLLGEDGARLLQNAIESASEFNGIIAAVAAMAVFVLISSGVFVELRFALNAVWRVRPRGETLTRFLRARAASFGVVIALGLILLTSLIVDTVIGVLAPAINSRVPFGTTLVRGTNFLLSFALVTLAFGAIYKLLPARNLTWRNVAIGAVVTAILFSIGRLAIGTYLGSAGVGSSYGVAGALIALLFWIYYSALIFLFGAALTKAYVVGGIAARRQNSDVARRGT